MDGVNGVIRFSCVHDDADPMDKQKCPGTTYRTTVINLAEVLNILKDQPPN